MYTVIYTVNVKLMFASGSETGILVPFIYCPVGKLELRPYLLKKVWAHKWTVTKNDADENSTY